MLNLVEEMLALAAIRPIFHSEADFQHALALSLIARHPDLELRLEHPRDGVAGAIDIIGRSGGRRVLALELKYLCGAFAVPIR